MRATTCGVSAPVDSSDKGYFRSFRTIHSSHYAARRRKAKVVRDILGHANIDVTQNVYGKCWWEERVDAAAQAVKALTNATQNAEKGEKRISRNPSATNGCPFGCPSRPELQVVGELAGVSGVVKLTCFRRVLLSRWPSSRLILEQKCPTL